MIAFARGLERKSDVADVPASRALGASSAESVLRSRDGRSANLDGTEEGGSAGNALEEAAAQQGGVSAQERAVIDTIAATQQLKVREIELGTAEDAIGRSRVTGIEPRLRTEDTFTPTTRQL